MITIVRGAVPLALFGAEGYGTVLGLIATPILLVNAFSPAAFALLVDQFGCHYVDSDGVDVALVSWGTKTGGQLRGNWRMTAHNRLAVILVLGITQTLGWASSFYLPAILGDRIAEDLSME